MKVSPHPYSRSQKTAITDTAVLERRKALHDILSTRDGGTGKLDFLPMFSRDASGAGFTQRKVRLLEDELRPHSNLIRAGASVVSFELATETQLPAIDPAQLASWGGPNETDPTSTLTLLQPRRLSTKIVVSKMLLKQNASVILPFIERQLFSAIAAELERAALLGSGAAGQPLGITLDPNVTRTTAAPSAANVRAAERAISEDFLDNGISLLVSPQTREKFRGTAGTVSPVWTSELPQYVSPHLVGDSALVGSFSDLILATFGPVDLLTDPYSQDTEGFITIRASIYADAIALRPGSFHFIKA